ncbi:GldG family protein [Kiritimatiellota bacterium B12222]|nr:GldG family protein [Kiritimatiellota bacterium B12222]
MNKSSDPTAKRMVWGTRFRKGASGAHLTFNLLLFLLLWGMVNYMGMRNYIREDWSQQQLTTLSPKTLSVLESIEEPVDVTLLLSQDFLAGSQLEDLIKEYKRYNSYLNIEVVDPDQDIAETDAIRSEFQVSQPDQVILEYRGRHLVVSMEKMLVMESDETRKMGAAPRMMGFQGEAVLTSALLELTRTHRPVVYFLTGHGEKDIDNFEKVPAAYSVIREKLEADNIEVRSLNLDETGGIPVKTDLLIIAGPRTRISQPEIDILRGYMSAKGRLMVLLDAGEDAGLISFLKEFGIQLLSDVVVDPSRTLKGADVHVTSYTRHPITDSMNMIRSIFIRPRSVLPAMHKESAAADRPKYTPLVASTNQGWAELRPNLEPIEFNQGVDQQGPIPIAAAVEWNLSGDPNDKNGKRLVVFGDSLFPGNWLNNGGGMLLMQNAVNWLLFQEDLLEIPPKEVSEIRLQLDKSELNRLLLLVGVLLPGAVMILGIVVSLRRRK